MLNVEGFVETGRDASRDYASGPDAEFVFGNYRVSSHVEIPTGLPRKGVGSRCRLTVTDAASGSRVVGELERVGMPLMTELRHGVSGSVDGAPISVHRGGGLALRRRDRIVEISGVVDLSLGCENRHSTIRRATPESTLLWSSVTGGVLSPDARDREATVICLLVVNSVHKSSSLLRFLPFI